jgi:hypothetical protein
VIYAGYLTGGRKRVRQGVYSRGVAPLLALQETPVKWALLALRGVWLPFLNTYRTMCLAPKPEFRRVLEEIREMPLGA